MATEQARYFFCHCLVPFAPLATVSSDRIIVQQRTRSAARNWTLSVVAAASNAIRRWDEQRYRDREMKHLINYERAATASRTPGATMMAGERTVCNRPQATK
jgi:hypothetical protein